VWLVIDGEEDYLQSSIVNDHVPFLGGELLTDPPIVPPPPFFLSFFLSQITTGAMILVTVECRRAGMKKNELVDPVCCLGV